MAKFRHVCSGSPACRTCQDIRRTKEYLDFQVKVNPPCTCDIPGQCLRHPELNPTGVISDDDLVRFMQDFEKVRMIIMARLKPTHDDKRWLKELGIEP